MMEISGDPIELPTVSAIETMHGAIQRFPEKIFYIEADTGKSYNYQELFTDAIKVAKGLRSLGIGTGDVVSLLSKCSFEQMVVNLGIWFSGASSNPINPLMTTEELAVVLNTTKPSLIYCQKRFNILEEAKGIINNNVPILRREAEDNEPNLDHWLSGPFDGHYQLPKIDLKSHVIAILLTSGTTGHPKGIKLRDLEFQIVNESYSMDPNNLRILLTSPSFFVSNTSTTITSISRTSTLVVPKFPATPEGIVEAIEKYSPQSWYTVPENLFKLMERTDIRSRNFSSIQVLITASSPLNRAQKLKISEVLFKNRILVKHFYAATETGRITRWSDSIDINSEEYESVGKVADGVRLKVIDQITGKALGVGEIGEICVKSNMILAGILFSDGTESSGTDDQGWVHTGDLGYYDKKNLVYIVGRIKDIMKFCGIQIAPAEVENIISKHEDVTECCVVGKPDEQNGELPTAFVVRRPGSHLTEDELSRFVAERVTDIKKLRGGVHFLESLPKNSVGKVQRFKLLETLKTHI